MGYMGNMGKSECERRVCQGVGWGRFFIELVLVRGVFVFPFLVLSVCIERRDRHLESSANPEDGLKGGNTDERLASFVESSGGGFHDGSI